MKPPGGFNFFLGAFILHQTKRVKNIVHLNFQKPKIKKSGELAQNGYAAGMPSVERT
jgi:hypothetical protein